MTSAKQTSNADHGVRLVAMLMGAVLSLKRQHWRCIIDRMETVELQVEGMDCDGCVKSVTRMLSGVRGVEKVDVSLEQGRARVTYDPAKSGIAEFKRAVERAGYKAP